MLARAASHVGPFDYSANAQELTVYTALEADRSGLSGSFEKFEPRHQDPWSRFTASSPQAAGGEADPRPSGFRLAADMLMLLRQGGMLRLYAGGLDKIN